MRATAITENGLALRARLLLVFLDAGADFTAPAGFCVCVVGGDRGSGWAVLEEARLNTRPYGGRRTRVESGKGSRQGERSE